jgi:hypothetical protein
VQHGIISARPFIKYACEDELLQKISNKKPLTAPEKQTLAVYKLYSKIAAENPSLNK